MRTFPRIEQFNAEKNGLSLSADFFDQGAPKLVLRLEGSLETNNSNAFMELILTLLESVPLLKTLVIDLEKNSYISSTGIGSFTNILVQCKKKNIDFFLSGVSDKTLNIMKMLGFSSYFKMIEKPEDV